MAKKFDVFISYRRKGGYDTAKLIYDRLRLDGYSVSFDIDTLSSGNFDKELEQRVSDCNDFLLVLSPGSFDRFFEPNPEDDWVRREIACALRANKKNIVPLIVEGFTFPRVLPDDVKGVASKNAIDLYPKYFEAAYEKVKSFLISKPSWVMKHKKKIISFVVVAFLALATFSFLTISHLRENLDSIEQSQRERRELRQQERTLHWNGPNNDIGELIFEKVAETGVQKTECSGRGLIASLNSFSCRGSAEITCFYSPRISFANCDNRPVTFFEKEGRFRSEPQKDSASAIAELLNKLREADFSDWVSEMKRLREGLRQ